MYIGTTGIIIYLGIQFDSNPEILMQSFVFNNIECTNTSQCIYLYVFEVIKKQEHNNLLNLFRIHILKFKIRNTANGMHNLIF